MPRPSHSSCKKMLHLQLIPTLSTRNKQLMTITELVYFYIKLSRRKMAALLMHHGIFNYVPLLPTEHLSISHQLIVRRRCTLIHVTTDSCCFCLQLQCMYIKLATAESGRHFNGYPNRAPIYSAVHFVFRLPSGGC
jgi:hypothetical protein